MTTTLGGALTSVRNRLDESTARQWSDARLREWIMEGARDVARRCECLLATTTFAVTAGVNAYSLVAITPGIVRIHRVEFVPTGSSDRYPLEYRDRHAMDTIWGSSQNIATGTPEYFTLWGVPPSLTVQFFPTPQIGGVATLYYYALPVPLITSASTDHALNVDCPDGWEDLIYDYAEYHALRMDRDERWKDVMGAYETRLADLHVTSIRWSDQGGHIASGTGFVPAWLADGGWG